MPLAAGDHNTDALAVAAFGAAIKCHVLYLDPQIERNWQQK
jgi:hypothetical protein